MFLFPTDSGLDSQTDIGRALDVEYAPTSYDQVAGQDSVLTKLVALRKRNSLGRRFFWIAGSSGTGKTTIARLLANEIAPGDYAIEELQAHGLTAAKIRDLARARQTAPLGGGCHVLIINEAHTLRAEAVTALCQWYDSITAHGERVAIIYTTTTDGALLFDDHLDAAPLRSRCVDLSLSLRGICDPLTDRALHVATDAQLIGDGIDKADARKRIKKRMQAERNNLRAVLQWIEAGALL